MDPLQLKGLLSEHLIPDLSLIVLDYMDVEVRFLRQLEREGSREEEFISPRGIAVLSYPDRREEIIVTDAGNHWIQVLSSSDGKILRQWGREGSGEGEFDYPSGIAVLPFPDGGGEIVVADTRNSRIQMFTPDGKFLRQWGQKGSGEGEFDFPDGIAVLPLPDGRTEIIVVDTHNHRIQVFTSRGKFLRQWGLRGSEEGEFNTPGGVAVLSLSNGRREIVVADMGIHRIQVFTPEGKFLRQWGQRGSGEGELDYPGGVAVLSSLDGREKKIIIADSYDHRIQVFSSDGKFFQQWRQKEEGSSLLSRIAVLSVPGGREKIIVTDVNNHRIRVFGLFLV